MIVSDTIEKMIGFSNGNIHDIDHFLKVWALATSSVARWVWTGIRRRCWS